MDDVGKEADVSRPTVYRCFGDRDALLCALIERRSRMLFERARTYLNSSRNSVLRCVVNVKGALPQR